MGTIDFTKKRIIFFLRKKPWWKCACLRVCLCVCVILFLLLYIHNKPRRHYVAGQCCRCDGPRTALGCGGEYVTMGVREEWGSDVPAAKDSFFNCLIQANLFKDNIIFRGLFALLQKRAIKEIAKFKKAATLLLTTFHFFGDCLPSSFM